MENANTPASLPWKSWIDGPLLGFSIESADLKRIGEVPVSVALVYFEAGHELADEWAMIDTSLPLLPGDTELGSVSTGNARADGVPLPQALADLVFVVGEAKRAACPIVGWGVGKDLALLSICATAFFGRGVDVSEQPILDVGLLEDYLAPDVEPVETLTDLAARYGVQLAGNDDPVGKARTAVEILYRQAQRHRELAELSPNDVAGIQAVGPDWWKAAKARLPAAVGPEVAIGGEQTQLADGVSRKRDVRFRPGRRCPTTRFRLSDEGNDRIVVSSRSRLRQAARAGHRLVRYLTEVHGHPGVAITVHYGRLARYQEQNGRAEIWFQPSSKARARRLALPAGESEPLTWLAAELVGEDDLLVLTTPVRSTDFGPRYDGEIVAMCITPAVKFSSGARVVTCGPQLGAHCWPVEVNVPPLPSARRRRAGHRR